MYPVFENIRLSRSSQHILFWVVWVVSFTYIKSIGYGLSFYIDWLLYYILTLPIFIAHTYIIAYWLVPRYFLTKKYIIAFLIFSGLFYGFSIVELICSNDFIFKYLSTEIQPEENYLDFKNVIISGIGNHYIIILFLSIKVLKSWYAAENERNELQVQTIESEMELIKNQLQPRFLLNVMNYLEEMALEKSEKTPEMIIRISNLMNSIMLERVSDRITLSKELNLIESFIDIQKMVQNLGMITQVARSGDLESRKIPALFFFPLVEKIMKLFTYSEVGNDFRILAKNEHNYLLFLTSFYYYNGDPYSKLEDEFDKLRKRLEYYYGDQCSFDYNYSTSWVELTIEIFKQ